MIPLPDLQTSSFAHSTVSQGRLAVDPGLDTGWALFHSSGELAACGLNGPPFGCARDVVIERPQVYPSHPVPPNDLITLAVQVGRYAGAAEATGASVRTCVPHEWKGNLPKDICARRIVRALKARELSAVTDMEATVPAAKRHNVIDAIGIGLFAFRGLKL